MPKFQLTSMRNFIDHDLGKGRLSLPVLTYKCDLAPTLYQKINIFQNIEFSVGFSYIFSLNNYFSRLNRNWESNIHHRIIIFIYFNPVYFIQFFYQRLCHRRLGSFRTEFFDQFFSLLDLFFLILLRSKLLCSQFLPKYQVF